MPDPVFNISDWYWIVGIDTATAWSSARAQAVSTNDAGYLAFVAGGGVPRRISPLGITGKVARISQPNAPATIEGQFASGSVELSAADFILVANAGTDFFRALSTHFSRSRCRGSRPAQSRLWRRSTRRLGRPTCVPDGRLSRMKKLSYGFVVAALLLGAGAAPADAQTACKYISQGAVLTATQWNWCFQQKQDGLGFSAVNKAGDVMLGRLVTAPPSGSVSGLNLTPGTAPLSPADGDIWTTTGGLYVRINGSTIGPITAGLPLSSTANYFLAGPTTGSPAAPTFRAMVDADLPGGVSGSGAVVKQTSPSLTTPSLGAATVTSVNKVAITAPASSATLTVANGSTLTASSTTSVGQGQYLATATNDNASSGNIGEYVSSDIPSGSAVGLVSVTPKNLTSISLTAGDWDVACVPVFTPGGNVTYVEATLSTTSATLDTTLGRLGVTSYAAGTAVAGAITSPVLPARFSLSSTTTIYCVAQASFTVSMTVYGNLHARRVR